MTSIAASLGIGSGIDTVKLVEDLTTATRAPKEAAIARREALNSAKISALGAASGGIDNFASSLTALIAGGSLFTQPTSSEAGILGVSALPGSRLGALSAQIEVRQLAQAQTLVSTNHAGASAAIGQGTLTLNTANGSFAVTIDSSNATLDGLARAINAATGSGVTANIVSDTNGARLVLKSATGAAQAFTVTADAALADFAYDPLVSGGMTRAQTAQDAIVRLDGVDVQRATNSFSDLVPGVKFDLKKAAIGTVVTLGSARPTAEIRAAMGDFVTAFNELKKVLDEATAARAADGSGGGALRGDAGIRELQRQLSQLSSTVLASGGGPATLAEIGIRTNRDGSLSLDTARLDAMLASNPDGVEAMFNPVQTSSSPLIAITSALGATKPGTYTLTNVVVSPPSATIAGFAALPLVDGLAASVQSPAYGLIIKPLGDVASATITVDAGLGGALKAIRDALRATNGPLAATQSGIDAEKKAVAEDRLKMEARLTVYHDQLVKSFTAMETRVSAFKATQSYLDQQIKLWTRDD